MKEGQGWTRWIGMSELDRVLEQSTCYAFELGPSILWVLPWRANEDSELFRAYADPRDGELESTAVSIDSVRLLDRYACRTELPARHSPAWTLPTSEVPDSPVEIEQVVLEME